MLKLYNTLTRKKEVFKPIKRGMVKIYSCGPTVYGYAHIGNLSAYIFADLLKRYLRFLGYKTIDVMNITDIDDKTIKASLQKAKSLKEYTSFFASELLKDFDKLNIKRPKILCKASEHIEEMINLVTILIDKKFAYKASDGSVYYKISAFSNYGKLSKLAKVNLKQGASGRITNDEYDKTDVSDFVLWKAWKKDDGDNYWQSLFGKGRPGWHIECSAMSMKYLGSTFDIHTGAIDLIFPHHENEIAQSEAATGKPFVHYWMHRGYLRVNNQKMSKSLGNFYTLKEILKTVPNAYAFRYLVLSGHYRINLNFTFDALRSSMNALERIKFFLERLSKQKDIPAKEIKLINKEIKKAREEFMRYMDDDLNTPKAIACFFNFLSRINKLIDKGLIGGRECTLIIEFLEELDRILGFIFWTEEGMPEDFKNKNKNKNKIEELIRMRNIFRQKKEWKNADKIRDRLIKMGVRINDNQHYTDWSL